MYLPCNKLQDFFVLSVCVSQGSLIFSSLFFWTCMPAQLVQKHFVTKEKCRWICVFKSCCRTTHSYMRTERISEEREKCKTQGPGRAAKTNCTEKSSIRCLVTCMFCQLHTILSSSIKTSIFVDINRP